MDDAIGLLETIGLTPALVALDAMDKAGRVRVLQYELNDFYGVSIKIAGSTPAVTAAIEAGQRVAEQMQGQPIVDIILRPDPRAMPAIMSARESNPLLEQDVVFFPDYEALQTESRPPMSQDKLFALGLIETQGFTAVFEAIDTACKAANVEVVGKEKLGGGYVTVIIRGELSAVTAAVEAGQAKVGELGKLIAAHVLARPSPGVLSLLPKAG
jgi:carbon dioxide concentrating mechanism protein CcmO